MDAMEERERAYESKFAHDEEMKFKAVARCNRLAGLWAAEILGLPEDEREAYALQVVEAGFSQGSDNGALALIDRDLRAAGVHPGEEALRAKFDALLIAAMADIQAGQ
ncbi:DUF1476 domain-containing protein [Rhizobium sp. NRK18]|uniref:DUF1476 domain-containing protein n=1 Tax=Rhizobium sp. NRK18 TaxID=2964667 RepID=UPI0021C383B7|nr:DUF1476 domain-containing protein [Rhizobium sp. NRK18]MCQ2004065.1 DUF1476 domain-containing protein [Rhizobium sp. NRK18]